MCLAPQRFLRHLNFQEWSGPGVFCTFWLRNVLRATTACTFSTSQLLKVVRTWCVLYIFDFDMCFAPQRRALFRQLNFQKWSEHGVFCAFWLRHVLRATTACNFSSLIWPDGSTPEPTFQPSRATNHWKTQCFATFPPFRASASSFFWLLWSSLFYSSFLFDSSHLCFSSVHIVGSLTSKPLISQLGYLGGPILYGPKYPLWVDPMISSAWPPATSQPFSGSS